MHGLGKFLLFLVVVGGVAGVALSAQLLNIRGSWQKQLVDLEQQVVAKQQAVEKLENDVESAKRDIGIYKTQYGQLWEAPQATILDQQEGEISLGGVGTSVGFGLPPSTNGELPQVHLFNVTPNGSQYLGEFITTGIQETTSRVRATSPPLFNQAFDPNGRPSQQPYQWDPAVASNNWPAGVSRIRVREQIPDEYELLFSEIKQFLDHQSLAHTNAELNIEEQEDDLAKVRKSRDYRIAELLGDSFLPQNEQVPAANRDAVPEVVSGYLKALDEADEQRNTVLAELDDLRRQVKRTQDRIDALMNKNRSLASQLPGQSDAASTSATESEAGDDRVSTRP